MFFLPSSPLLALSALENQPRRNEEHEGFSCSIFVFFVASWLIFIVSGRRHVT